MKTKIVKSTILVAILGVVLFACNKQEEKPIQVENTVGLSVGPITLGAGTVAGVLGGKAVGSWAASSAAMVAFGIYDAWVDFFWG